MENAKPFSASIRFDHAHGGFDLLDGFPAQLSPAVQPIANNFLKNMMSLSATIDLPLNLTFAAKVFTISRPFACADLGIDFRRKDLTREQNEKIDVHTKVIVARNFEMVSTDDSHREKVRKAAADDLNILLDNWHDSTPELIESALRAMLSNAIVSAWTAFEVLATDLWVAAVNELPKTLGVNALLSPQRDRQRDEGLPEGARPKRNPISLDTLIEYNFDLSSRLGEMLSRRSEFSFNSLEGIKNAYFETFCGINNKGDKCRSSDVIAWFGGEDYGDLIALEAHRHILVHRAGIADKAFVDRMKSHQRFSAIDVGDEIPLDGDLVAMLIAVSIKRAKMLADGINVWLSNPKS